MASDSTLAVRPASEQDFEPLSRLFERVAAERRWIAAEPPVDRKQVRALWAALLSTGEGALFMHVSTGEPTGLAAVRRGSPAELGMLVALEFRGRGIGSALLAACIDWARAAGSRKLILRVFAHNTAAIALYRKFGFEEEQRLRSSYLRQNGERWDALAMSLAL